MSRYARRRAAIIDRDRTELESPGVRAASRIMLAVRVRAGQAVAAGDYNRAGLVSGEAIKQFMPAVRDAMLAAHLRGRFRMIESATPKLRNEPLVLISIGPYEDAVDLMTRRLNMTRDQVEELRKAYGNTAVEAVRGLGDYVDRMVINTLERQVRRGEHVRGGTAGLRRLFEDIGITEVRDRNGKLLNRAHLLETIFRTQIQQAYAAGRWQAAQDPAIDEILWGWEYVTVGDDRVRFSHMLLDGTRAPKSDPIWKRITPPNGYNCRCSTIEVFSDQADLASTNYPQPRELDGQTIQPEPDRGFDYNPGEVFGRGVPMPRVLPPDRLPAPTRNRRSRAVRLDMDQPLVL